MWQPGQNVDVRMDRNGEEVVVKTTLTQSYTTGTKLIEDKTATQAQKALLNAWLKG